MGGKAGPATNATSPTPLRRPGFTGTTPQRPPFQVPARGSAMAPFPCPHRKGVLRAPDDRAGTKGLCPKCGQKVQLPARPLQGSGKVQNVSPTSAPRAADPSPPLGAPETLDLLRQILEVQREQLAYQKATLMSF